MDILFYVTLGLLIVTGTILVVMFTHFHGKALRLERELERVQLIAKEESEYKALASQVAELEKLRDNLDAQVELDKRYLNEAATTKALADYQIKSANTQFKDITEKLEATEKLLKERKSVADDEAIAYKKMKLDGMDAELAAEAERKRKEATEALVKELATLREEIEERRNEKLGIEDALIRLHTQLEETKRDADSAAETYAEALRRQVMEQGCGGTINLGQSDRQDIETIRKMAKGLRCENAVLKAMYDVYVKPEIERIVRESGVAGVSGIYRIWAELDGKTVSYIGQAVDIGERWKTHAKRAWGVDNTGRIVLYQVMMQTGIEVWHWELVETVDAGPMVGLVLSEKEKYWGKFYGVKELGLNKKLG